MPEEQSERHRLIEKREGFWFAEPSREALLDELHALYTDPPRHRTRSLAIIGDRNDGKSQIIKQFLARHPIVELGELTQIPAIAIEMSDIVTIQEFSRRLLEQIRAVSPRAGTHEERMKRFVVLAKQVGLRMIFLDEFHDCADTTGKGKPFLRIIKNLTLKHFFVVPVGVVEVEEVLKKDPQLANRFNLSVED
ncbi:MAG: TniB [Deinococcota bacterium]